MNHRNTASLQRTLDALDLIPALRDPHEKADVRAVLQAEINRRQNPPVHFDWPEPGRFVVNGRSWTSSKGMVLAFMAIAGHMHGMEPLPASYFFSGKRAQASVTQALDRAAETLQLHCKPLADAIKGIGTSRGLIVVKKHAPNIHCSSAWLTEFSNRAAALGYEA